ARWNLGFVVITPENPRHVVLLVTLHKGDMASQFQYGDHFLAPDMFQWQSQNRTKQSGKHGTLIRDHATLGGAAHLFVRAGRRRSMDGAGAYVYCRRGKSVGCDGDAPIKVRWRLTKALPGRLMTEFSDASSGRNQVASRGYEPYISRSRQRRGDHRRDGG